MVRMRRALTLRPINTVKHYIQNTLTSLGAAAAATDTLADAVAVRGTPNQQVQAGSVIKSIFIERWIRGEADNNIFGLIVTKLPSGLSSPSQADCTNLNDYENKKNILYMTYGTLSAVNPTPVIRQWIKIPTGKGRMGLGDRIAVTIWTQLVGLNYCGFATYKEFT